MYSFLFIKLLLISILQWLGHSPSHREGGVLRPSSSSSTMVGSQLKLGGLGQSTPSPKGKTDLICGAALRRRMGR